MTNDECQMERGGRDGVLRRPRCVQRRNVGAVCVIGVIGSARYYAGGDAAARRPYLSGRRTNPTFLFVEECYFELHSIADNNCIALTAF
jgi:hypothetical protein